MSGGKSGGRLRQKSEIPADYEGIGLSTQPQPRGPPRTSKYCEGKR